MEKSTNVQTLINQFELLAQANAVSSSRQSKYVPEFKTTIPKTDHSMMKKFIECMNTQRSRTQSEPLQRNQCRDAEISVKPVEKLSGEEEALMDTSMKASIYKGLSVDTSEKYDITTRDSTFYSMFPRSPSAHSATSTCSLDSLRSSLDPLLPNLLQVPAEDSAEVVLSRFTRSRLHEDLQLTTTSKLIPPTSYRRSFLARKSLYTTTRESSIPFPKSTRCSSKSAQAVAVSSPPARSLSNPSSSPRYMNYDTSPRYAATKAWNIERRRQLEERNRSLAIDKAKLLSSRTTHRARQGRVDHVQSRLYDLKETCPSHNRV